MSETALQEQIQDLHRKIDFLIEEVALQKAKRQELEDLVDDLQIIGKDMFNTAVTELDKSGVEVNSECVARLGLNMVKNVRNFNYIMDTMQSTIDFWEDFAPILRQIGLDAIHKFAEFEQKGYFEYLKQIFAVMETLTRNYSTDDLKRLNENVPVVISIVRNLSSGENLAAMERLSRTMAQTNMDDTLDDKSLFKIYKELKSPEVRKSISWVLRVLRASVQENQTNINNNK
jgi:uncharacterized protein YjgD (DUF1641 family)